MTHDGAGAAAMKIAYLVSQYPASSHTFIRREVEALRGAGIDVHTFSVRAPDRDELAAVDLAEHARTYFLLENKSQMVSAHLRQIIRRPRRYVRTLRDAIRHRGEGTRPSARSLFYFAEAILLASELERREIAHLHNHFANAAATVGYLASRHLSVPWSVTLHGSVDLDFPARATLPLKIEQARFVVCASHFMRSQAMRVVPPSLWTKMILVRCGVEAERCPRRDPVRSASRLRILSVGRLSPEKGQLGLLDAFRAVLDSGVDAELDLIGDGPLRAALEEHAVSLGLGDRFRMLGRQTEGEVLRRMSCADVFALSSLMEGLPVVLMEAMAVGLPVVAPAVAGIPELVDPGKTGLLFPAGDFPALARALVRLCREPELGQRLAAAARARVLGELTLPAVAQPLIDELRSSDAPLPAAEDATSAPEVATPLPRPLPRASLGGSVRAPSQPPERHGTTTPAEVT